MFCFSKCRKDVIANEGAKRWLSGRTLPLYHAAAMKPGTAIPGLNCMKGKEPIVALKRSEYPDWVNDLSKPKISLAKLRRMAESEATDREKMRYLKLTRRFKMKDNNSAAEAR